MYNTLTNMILNIFRVIFLQLRKIFIMKVKKIIICCNFLILNLFNYNNCLYNVFFN